MTRLLLSAMQNKPWLPWLIASVAFLAVGGLLVWLYGLNFLSGMCLGMAAILAANAYDESEGR